jgi:uncharacterized metal-binding protein YceD (DUF177 family)
VQSEVLKEYQVKILTLHPGRYTYTFLVSDDFFASFEYSVIQKGQLKVVVTFEKTETLIRATFAVDGVIQLESDRTLESFDYPVSTSQQLIYKFGEDNKELSEEMFQIAWDTPAIDLAQPIFEFLTLEVPMRKLAPGEEEEPEGTISDDERRLVYQSTPSEVEEADADAAIDPQWAALRNLFPN